MRFARERQKKRTEEEKCGEQKKETRKINENTNEILTFNAVAMWFLCSEIFFVVAQVCLELRHIQRSRNKFSIAAWLNRPLSISKMK